MPLFGTTRQLTVPQDLQELFDIASPSTAAETVRVLIVAEDDRRLGAVSDRLDQGIDHIFVVDRAYDRADALQQLRQGQHDIVLITCDFPDFSNMDLLDSVAEGGCNTPAILLTGSMNRAARQQALQRGAADYLTLDNLDSQLLERAVHYAVDSAGTRAALVESERRFRSAFEDSATGMAIESLDGTILRANRAYSAMLGHQPETLQGRLVAEFMHREDTGHDIERRDELLSGATDCYSAERRYLHAFGHVVDAMRSSSVVRSTTGEPLYVVVHVQDISAHKHAERLVQRQLSRLSAFRAIDLAIVAPTPLEEKLAVILEQVMETLRADAAVILLTEEDTDALRHAASYGFRRVCNYLDPYEHGHDLAYRAARERRVISIPDVSLSVDFAETGLISDEQFQSCVVLPLIAQGRAYGALEVYRRRPLSGAEDWITFLQAVATQTAIAIDNAELIENLSESNRNLTIAYDRTLEGWSRALEMRDDETNGHSRRVTELAVQLAQRFGITGEELDNLRRGALLHDIGKMAIPDSILLKRGPLTANEREIMRRHPVYGFELLSKIPYLEPALDIPFAHHEKWDGSGYPRGLSGNEIPLAARIFSIIDVWDALTTDRPYRAAWQPEAARKYIRAQAGLHFDPLVVEEFLKLNLPGSETDRLQVGMRKL